MTAPVARTVPVSTGNRIRPPLAQALASLYVGAAAAAGLVAILVFMRTSSDDAAFRYVGDYLNTANGIPFMLSLLTLLPALRALQQRRDGRLGLAGMIVTGIGGVVLLGIFVYGLIAATGSSLGPTYVLASGATDIGVVLFAAGSWRAGLVPRWLLVCWPLAWIFGSMLPFWKLGPLVLAAVYLAIAVTLPRRVRQGNHDPS
jgi:hypothetical protein